MQGSSEKLLYKSSKKQEIPVHSKVEMTDYLQIEKKTFLSTIAFFLWRVPEPLNKYYYCQTSIQLFNSWIELWSFTLMKIIDFWEDYSIDEQENSLIQSNLNLMIKFRVFLWNQHWILLSVPL